MRTIYEICEVMDEKDGGYMFRLDNGLELTASSNPLSQVRADAQSFVGTWVELNGSLSYLVTSEEFDRIHCRVGQVYGVNHEDVDYAIFKNKYLASSMADIGLALYYDRSVTRMK